MLFELSEEEKLIRAAAVRFAKHQLEPVAAELDRTLQTLRSWPNWVSWA